MINKKYLITTAIQRTWKEDTSVLFLGEWCKRYSEKEKWENLNYETVGYHWDNREKFHEDHLYLNDLYEDFLNVLASNLNEYHKSSYDLEYWRIIVGPWLIQFIEILFDRWQMIEKVTIEFDIARTAALKIDDCVLVPHNMEDFMTRCTTDLWNHYIYIQIIKEISSSINIDVIVDDSLIPNNTNLNKNIKNNQLSSILAKVKKYIRKIFNLATDFFNRNSKYFFIDIYLSSTQQFKLEFSLKTIPSWFMSRYREKKRPCVDERPTFINSVKPLIKFEAFALKIIQKQIPTTYLEGFKDLKLQVKSCKWPRSPNVIMTSGSHFYNDFFKVWAAEKITMGSKLVVAQHSGSYGSLKRFSYEKHELAIADKFFSWGWSEYGSKKIVYNSPGRLINSKINLKYNKKGGLLLVLTSFPRYSYHLYSGDISSQLLSYEKDQLRFAQKLSKEIRDDLTVRPYVLNYGWDSKARWNDQFPKVVIDEGKSFYTTMMKNRLIIGSSISTVMFEALSANVPIVAFWNPNQWELRESAKPYYDLLISVNILHESPDMASDFVNSMWNGIEAWWSSIEVQKVRIQFCSELGNSEEDWIKHWKTNLSRVG